MKINNVIVSEDLPVAHIHTSPDLAAWITNLCTTFNVTVSITRYGESPSGLAEVRVCGKEANVLRCLAILKALLVADRTT